MSRWSGIIAQENVPTGDGRMLAPDSLQFDQLPVPFRWVRSDVGAHDGAEVVGRVLEVWREGDDIRASGDFDLGSDVGLEALRQVEEGLTTGVSVDLDDVDVELRIVADLLGEDEPVSEEPAVDPDGRVTVGRMDADDELYVIVSARLRALTLVATPAIAEAHIELAKKDKDDKDDYSAIVASSGARPSVEWFRAPQLSEPTPLQVTEDGRLFGHIALWGSCHVGYGSECVSPPPSPSSYAYFRTGSVVTKEGHEVPTGRITMDTVHAGRRLGPADTAAHYDHTGLAVADVAAGEDKHGIWIAGWIRPGVSDEQKAVLQASSLSGDWRRIGGALELVSVLAVNTPGFPIPRALVASGRVVSLQSGGHLELPERLRESVSDDVVSKVRKAKVAARMRGR